MIYFAMLMMMAFSFCCFADEGSGNPHVLVKTNKGEFEIELYEGKAPVTVKNFVRYVNDGFYDGTIFHRVIDGFMVQGGGFTKDMKEKDSREPISNEASNGLKNERGTLAMARTMVVDSASSQFFINVDDNDFLNHRSERPDEYGYAVFGRVVKGMDVVDLIKAVKTGSKHSHQDVPLETIVIEKAKVVER